MADPTAAVSLLPTDWTSFLWGVGVASIAAFGTGFLKKAGEAAAEHLKDKVKTKPSEHDKVLFAEFQRDVPADPITRLFKTPDFDGSFRRELLQPVYALAEKWGNVDKEFVDPQVEAAKKKLHASAWNVLQEISVRTVPVGDGTKLSVYPDNTRKEHRGEGRPEDVIEDAKQLNAVAKPFAEEYEAFVRLCRERLKL